MNIRLARRAQRDFDRITDHLIGHDVADVDARLGEILDALQLLVRHPLIGRPVAAGMRELVIGRGSRGYVALYELDEACDEVVVVALRGQREVGFGE